MKKYPWLFMTVAFMSTPEVLAAGPRQIEVERFIELPPDVRHPESITTDSKTQELYVGTFDARTPESSRNNQVLRFSASGALLARRSFGATPLTGIQYHKGHVERGRERFRAGSFLGIDNDGSPRGLLFPASTAVLGEWMIVANLSLPLSPSVGDEWEEEVRRWTLARFKLPK